jgi:hypothetical protein
MNILVSLTTFLLRTTVLITFTWYFWQDTLFGKRVTPAERLRQHQRTLEKAQRELDRERVKLENQVGSGGIFAFRTYSHRFANSCGIGCCRRRS